jgi:hypothetical protein
MEKQKIFTIAFSSVYPLQKIRYLDKLIDELAKGKPMEKILRK